jgi:segregation and condensation protein A
MNQSTFEIKMDTFAGPLDLLLNLIEKRKLFINDISLSKITDDYLEYLKKLEDFSIPDSANFILIASTLVLIKSKSLLPTLNLTEEEQLSIDELQERLRVYKILKDATAKLREQFGREIIFPQTPSKIINPVFSPSTDLSSNSVLSSMQTLLVNLPKFEKLSKAVVEKVISLEEMINNLTGRIQTSLKMSFKEFSRSHEQGEAKKRENKINVIVSFLAMLELVKQGVINVTQQALFEDIQMETEQKLGV